MLWPVFGAAVFLPMSASSAKTISRHQDSQDRLRDAMAPPPADTARTRRRNRRQRREAEAARIDLPVRLKHLPGLLIALTLLAYISDRAATAGDSAICERQMLAASQTEGVPLGVLYAVGMTETGNKGSLHPYALNIQGRTIFTDSPQAALTEFAKARSQGIRLIDLGCMQINHYYHGRNFSSPAEMLEPGKNVSYAARYLRQLRQSEGSWTMAVARYHAGPNNNPAQKQYICTVIRNLAATGFGAWTPEARVFCR